MSPGRNEEGIRRAVEEYYRLKNERDNPPPMTVKRFFKEVGMYTLCILIAMVIALCIPHAWIIGLVLAFGGGAKK